MLDGNRVIVDKFSPEIFAEIVARIHVEQTWAGWANWTVILDGKVVAQCPSKPVAQMMARGLMGWLYLEEVHTPTIAEDLQKAIDKSIEE